jgi:APA family basic amino acid/polyamine antiporter
MSRLAPLPCLNTREDLDTQVNRADRVSSRMQHQMGSDRLLPKFVRKYDQKRDVAVNGVIISSVIGIVMFFSGNIYIMASNFGLLFSYLVTSFSRVHFRRSKATPS